MWSYSSLWSYLSGLALTVSGRRVCNMKQNKTWLLAVTRTGWPGPRLDTHTHSHSHTDTHAHSVWSFLWHSLAQPLCRVSTPFTTEMCWWADADGWARARKSSQPAFNSSPLCPREFTSLLCHIGQVRLSHYKLHKPPFNTTLLLLKTYTLNNKYCMYRPHFHQHSFIQLVSGYDLATLHLHLTWICIFMHKSLIFASPPHQNADHPVPCNTFALILHVL